MADPIPNSDNTPDTQEVSRTKAFNITTKSTNQWLLENRRGVTNEYADQLTSEIFQNARELTPQVNWYDITSALVWSKEGKIYRGIPAIKASVANVIGSIAGNMGWDMHAPEVVYMSSCAMIFLARRRLNYLNSDIDSINAGTHKFNNETDRDIKLKEETGEASKMATFIGRMSENTDAYASANLPDDENYTAVLRSLIHTGHSSATALRARALTAFKNGKFGEAREMLAKLPNNPNVTMLEKNLSLRNWRD